MMELTADLRARGLACFEDLRFMDQGEVYIDFGAPVTAQTRKKDMLITIAMGSSLCLYIDDGKSHLVTIDISRPYDLIMSQIMEIIENWVADNPNSKALIYKQE